MLRLEGQGVGEGLFPLLHGLPRQAVNEVQTHVREFGPPAGGHGLLHLLPCVDAAQGPETGVVRGLDPQGDAVEARPPQRPEGLPVSGAVGVGLQCDLGVGIDVIVLLYGFQQLRQPLLPQIAGGAAAKVHRVHRMLRRLRGHLDQVALQCRRVGVHAILPPGEGVEVAVGAFGPAEGDVQIQPQRMRLLGHDHASSLGGRMMTASKGQFTLQDRHPMQRSRSTV